MRKLLLTFVILIVVAVMSIYVYDKEKQKAAGPEDIHIDATLMLNDKENLDFYPYVMEVVIDKRKDSTHIIYPLIKGLGGIALDRKDEVDGYYIPGSIGTYGNDEEMVKQSYRDHNIFYPENSYFIGFSSPEETGVYKMKVYFKKMEELNPQDKMYLTYVHRGQRGYGLDETWSKIFEVKSGLE